MMNNRMIYKVMETSEKTNLIANVDIVASNAESFKTELSQLIYTSPAPVVELDLVDIEMVDSVGLGVLVAAESTLSKAGRKLAISGVSKED